MDTLLPILLLAAGVIAGLFLRDRQAKKKEVKEKVAGAADKEKEGVIDATLEFRERVKRAEKAVDDAIASRPDIDNPADRLADRIERSRRQRRQRRKRTER